MAQYIEQKDGKYKRTDNRYKVSVQKAQHLTTRISREKMKNAYRN